MSWSWNDGLGDDGLESRDVHHAEDSDCHAEDNDQGNTDYLDSIDFLGSIDCLGSTDCWGSHC